MRMHQDHPPAPIPKQNRRLIDFGILLVFSMAIAKLLLHLYASRNYGYFIDEL